MRPGLACAAAAAAAAFAAAAGPVHVSFFAGYDPDRPDDPSTRRIAEFTRTERPDIIPEKWGGLPLPAAAAGGRSSFMLSVAGGMAPDIYKAWFHILRHDIEQGFCAPLDEWAGRDEDGDGEISGAEAKWPGWKDVPPLWRRVAVRGGSVYGIPAAGCQYFGIVYNKAAVRAAGLDPESPPATWEEFERWCRSLKKEVRGENGRLVRVQYAFGIENRPWGFLPWVQAAGGDVVAQGPDGEWRAAFDSPQAVRAARFLKKLVDSGLARPVPALSGANDRTDLFSRGEIAAVFGDEDFVRTLADRHDFDPANLGIMPFPAADAGCRRVLQAHRHFYAMTEGVARRPKAERDAVWACMEQLCSRRVNDAAIADAAARGRARWCDPADLERLGLGEYAREIPPAIRQMYADLREGRIAAVTEPWMGFWQAASDLVSRRLLDPVLSGADGSFDCEEALRSITADANRGLMFDADKSAVENARPVARTVAGILAICVLAAAWMVWRARRRGGRGAHGGEGAGAGAGGRSAAAGARPSRLRALAPWIFLAPAIASIALWSYWPLLKGAAMAFQDYRIAGGCGFAGLDNFIRVSTDPNFWAAWGRTLEYAAISLALGFLAPVLLAVLLTEVPRGKVFFRTLYFLPHMTSALVVTLLWKMMFDPAESGMLNSFLAAFGVERHAWLQDPSWAMVCCILPGVWAGAGMSSLIYVAALSSLPRDYYEAAAIDGAGILARFRHVTFPQLAPLMVINFTGAFIAAFQGMGSIFLLTFGGPGDATTVLSILIWKEAYNNLRFSAATTMAWYLGAALIGFTWLQIRFLRRVEFRRAGGAGAVQ